MKQSKFYIKTFLTYKFNFPGNLLENYQSYNIMSTDILFKLTYTVCHEIATDSRFTLCKFGESMPLSMIDLKGPEEKYKLYLLLVQVHHPNGSPLGDDVTYTYNDDKWKAIINLLYKMILNDLRPTKLSENVIALGCEGKYFYKNIYIQMYAMRTILINSKPMRDFSEGSHWYQYGSHIFCIWVLCN